MMIFLGGRVFPVLMIAVMSFFVFPATYGISGQQELMDEWAKQKKEIAQKIVDKLRKEGKLPENGTIHFTARVKPLKEGELDIYVETLRVESKMDKQSNSRETPSSGNEKSSKEFAEIFRPRSPSSYWTVGRIYIGEGRITSENIDIKEGGSGKGFQEERNGESVTGKVMSNGSAKTFKDSEESSADTEKQEQGWWIRFWNKLLGKDEQKEKP